jgi:hypothetical protein
MVGVSVFIENMLYLPGVVDLHCQLRVSKIPMGGSCTVDETTDK